MAILKSADDSCQEVCFKPMMAEVPSMAGWPLCSGSCISLLSGKYSPFPRSGGTGLRPLHPPKGPSRTRFITGFRTLVQYQRHRHFQPPLSDICIYCSFVCLLITFCPLRWAGGCARHGLPASALSAQACMWVMRGTIYCVFDCPAFDGICCGFEDLSDDSHGSTLGSLYQDADGTLQCILYAWHKDQNF